MLTATPETKAPSGSLGVGEVNIAALRAYKKAPPRRGLRSREAWARLPLQAEIAKARAGAQLTAAVDD